MSNPNDYHEDAMDVDEDYSYPPASGFGATSSGFGGPSSGYGGPSSGYGATSSGFSKSSSGYGATSSGYGGPSYEYGGPSSGYGATSSGYGGPSYEYGGPSSGYGATSSGYGATSSGFGATSSGYGASPINFAPIPSTKAEAKNLLTPEVLLAKSGYGASPINFAPIPSTKAEAKNLLTPEVLLAKEKNSKKTEVTENANRNKMFVPAGTPPVDIPRGFNGNGGPENLQMVIIPKGTLLFSGYKQRNNNTPNAINDFMNLYLRGTRGLDAAKNQMCPSGLLNSYWNYLFFHPCPFFANGVSGYDFNSQGCWVVKSDIKLAVLYGYEMQQPINGLDRAGFRNSRSKPSNLNDFVANSCANFVDSKNNFYPWKKPWFLPDGKDFDACLYPPWMYDNEINGYITIAGEDSTCVQYLPNGSFEGKQGLHNMSNNNIHAWGTDSNSDSRFISYLNLFTSVMKKTGQGIDNKYTYGIPEIVLFAGSFEFIKDINLNIPKPNMSVNLIRPREPGVSDQLTDRVTTWKDNRDGIIRVTSDDKKNKVNNLAKFLSKNSDGIEGQCEGDSGLPKSQQSQLKLVKGTTNDFDTNSIYDQTKSRLFNDMQVVYPLFSGISNAPTRWGINNEVNSIINKIFYSLRSSGSILYDNCTGFFIEKDIFLTEETKNFQPIKKGQYSKVLIKNRQEYFNKWISDKRMNLLAADGTPSPSTYWLNSKVNDFDDLITRYKDYIRLQLVNSKNNQTKWGSTPDFLNSLSNKLAQIKKQDLSKVLIDKKTTIVLTSGPKEEDVNVKKDVDIGQGFFSDDLFVKGSKLFDQGNQASFFKKYNPSKMGQQEWISSIKSAIPGLTNNNANLDTKENRINFLLKIFVCAEVFACILGRGAFFNRLLLSIFTWAISFVGTSSWFIIVDICLSSIFTILGSSILGPLCIAGVAYLIHDKKQQIWSGIKYIVKNPSQTISNVKTTAANLIKNISNIFLGQNGGKKKIYTGGQIKTETITIQDTQTKSNKLNLKTEPVNQNQEETTQIDLDQTNEFISELLIEFMKKNGLEEKSEDDENLLLEDIPGIKKISETEYEFSNDVLTIHIEIVEEYYLEFEVSIKDSAVDKLLSEVISKYLNLIKKSEGLSEIIDKVSSPENILKIINYVNETSIKIKEAQDFKISESSITLDEVIDLDSKLIGNSIDEENGVTPLTSPNDEKLLSDKVGNKLITSYLNSVNNYREGKIPETYNDGVLKCNNWGNSPECLQDSNCFNGQDKLGNDTFGTCETNTCFYDASEGVQPTTTDRQTTELYSKNYFMRKKMLFARGISKGGLNNKRKLLYKTKKYRNKKKKSVKKKKYINKSKNKRKDRKTKRNNYM